MRAMIRHHVALGVDTIKLSMSGEQITETRDAQDCYFTDEETAACVDEAHKHGLRLCAHARARDSVKMCIKHGVDVIYHASWIDEEGMAMLEAAKDKHIVAPGINWLIATVYEATEFGYPFEKAEQVGYKAELDAAIAGLREMHRRGITVLPGGDYGFAWTPHGTYARDLEHFVKLLGFTAMESIVAATAGVAKLMMRDDELGKVRDGFLADLILVDGDPLHDINLLQKHARLHVVMINGRIHKIVDDDIKKDTSFLQVDISGLTMESNNQSRTQLTNFISYRLNDGTGRTRVGHLDHATQLITPVAFSSGTPVTDLYQVIEAPSIPLTASGIPFPLTPTLQVLAPLRDRDVLAIGKNYAEHAKEFNASGYDASDRNDLPSHPVVFTKRSTSIIAQNEAILLHDGFTRTLDYEGEIGVIIGKAGFRIAEAEADDYVWGYTIINDVTAREKQRDHKQFFIGKSGDGYCPMGPVAVPKEALLGEQPLRVTTKVNGEQRQTGTLEELIFSIPTLIKTISEAQTIRPGDVIATGTPFGVGFGMNPPVFLKPGDNVEISVTGLGTLQNNVIRADAENYLTKRIQEENHVPIHNLSRTNGGIGLTTLPSGKKLNVKTIGQGSETFLFIHGLGGSLLSFSPLFTALGLDNPENNQYRSVLLDLEGHGLSPTKATSEVTIASYAQDIEDLLKTLGVSSGATVLAHSMGCLIAYQLATHRPSLINQLILLGPPALPLSSAAIDATLQRAATVRDEGMRNVSLTVAAGATSTKTQASRPLSFAAVQMSLLSQDPEGYAKGCTALAGAGDLKVDFAALGKKIIIVTGAEDKISPPTYVQSLERATVHVLPDVGHWHIFEDLDGVAQVLAPVLKQA